MFKIASVPLVTPTANLQSLIADLRKDNQLLLDRLLIKNNSAPIVEPEPEVPPTKVEGEVFGVDE